MPEPDTAGDQDPWRLAMLAEVPDEAADEVDHWWALHCQGVGQNTGFPAAFDDLGGKDTFGYEYRRSVQLKKPIIRSSTMSDVVNRDI